MADKAYTAKKNGALFVQPDGPNTTVYYLGCYDLDDVEESFGEITLLQCFDESGNYQTVGFTEDAPEPISVSLGTWTGKRAEYMETLVCPAAIYAQLRCDGKASEFSNFERGVALDIAKLTSRTLSKWVARNDEGDGAMSMFNAQALPPIHDYFLLRGTRVSTSEANALNNIVWYNDLSCPGAGCSTPAGVCQNGFATTDATGGASANVLKTADSGVTWAATATDPFAVSENIVGAVKVRINRSTVRWIVGRGTTDAGNPAEIAYSDDEGATWTTANVGSTNAQFFNDSRAIFALDKNLILAVTTGGYIYRSTDGGLTWTAVESGIIGVNHYNAVIMKDRFTGIAVGVSDQIAVTIDGGLTWSAGGSPASGVNLTTLSWNGLYWYLGTSNGRLYYSSNDGISWTRRTGQQGDGTGAIDDISFLDKFIGFASQTITSVGYLLYTRDGGANWTRITRDTNAGLNQIAWCSETLAWAVGEVVSATGFIMKIQIQ